MFDLFSNTDYMIVVSIYTDVLPQFTCFFSVTVHTIKRRQAGFSISLFYASVGFTNTNFFNNKAVLINKSNKY